MNSQIISQMYDFYNDINDNWEERYPYMSRKDKAWYFFIKKNISSLHLLDEKYYYCFEFGYYPPKRKEE